jgi:hypothetical protein
MPKVGPWSRRKPLISWEKLGTEALNNYVTGWPSNVRSTRAPFSEGAPGFPLGQGRSAGQVDPLWLKTPLVGPTRPGSLHSAHTSLVARTQ